MPIGENLSIVACALLIGERILLDLGNLELGFHAIVMHDVFLGGHIECLLGKTRAGAHLGVVPQVMDE